MHDAGVVRGGQAVGDLRRQLEQTLEWNGPARQLVPERLPIDELCHDIRDRVVDGGVEDGDDVGMVQGAGGPSLRHKTMDAVGIGLRTAMKDLQRDVALETRVPRSIHLASAARTDERHDLVGAERRRRDV